MEWVGCGESVGRLLVIEKNSAALWVWIEVRAMVSKAFDS